MFHFRDNKNSLNRFRKVYIPKASKLFETFGLKQSEDHPDRTDPYAFSEPCNPSEQTAIGMLSATAKQVAQSYRQAKAEEARKAAEQAAKDAAAAASAAAKEDLPE